MITAEGLAKANQTLQSIDVKGKGYVQVTERVKAFRALCPDGTIETEIVQIRDGMVVMRATVSDGGRVLATGLAYEKETSSYINKTSYIENCETSAVGRALGFCGIGIDASMASAEELANALVQQGQIKAAETAGKKISKVKAAALEDVLLAANVNIVELLQRFAATNTADLTEEQHEKIISMLRKAGKI